MKFLIAGLGSVGRRHLRNLKALGETDILLYRTHRATLSDYELAGLSVETDLRRAFGMSPASVIVANPTSLYLGVAISAADGEKRRKFILDECTYTDGSAGRRTGEYLLGLIEESRKCPT